MFGALASATGSAGCDLNGEGCCVDTSVNVSTGFASLLGAGCCDSPHPTSTKPAIVVIRYFMDAVFVMRRSLLIKPDLLPKKRGSFGLFETKN